MENINYTDLIGVTLVIITILTGFYYLNRLDVSLRKNHIQEYRLEYEKFKLTIEFVKENKISEAKDVFNTMTHNTTLTFFLNGMLIGVSLDQTQGQERLVKLLEKLEKEFEELK